MNLIPSITVPIIKCGESHNANLFDLLKNKKVVIFGVPGAFTPTCSEKHLPGFINLAESIKKKGISEIYCLSINDPYVMKSWLLSYADNQHIYGIADGNGEVSKFFNLLSDKSANFMGIRSTRFAMIVKNNIVGNLFVEKPGMLEDTLAENILSKL
jgi:peroxiredoxin|tara:strand:- start:1079 stop:1546 length:468 start_codon:yes stop_codon:yes gene_type:complete